MAMNLLLAAADAAQNPSAFQQTKDTAEKSSQALMSSFHQAYDQVVIFAPRVLAMVIVLVIGYIIARFIGRVDHAPVRKDRPAATLPTVAAWPIRCCTWASSATCSAIVGTIVFWLLMCVFIMAAFDILDLPGVSAAMGKVVNYIPTLLIATVVVVVGLLIASFLRGVVATSADRIGLTYAEYLANGCYYVLALLTFYTALTQLGMDLDLLQGPRC